MNPKEVKEIKKSFGLLWNHSPHRIMARLIESLDSDGNSRGCRSAAVYATVTKTPITYAIALAKEMGWNDAHTHERN